MAVEVEVAVLAEKTPSCRASAAIGQSAPICGRRVPALLTLGFTHVHSKISERQPAEWGRWTGVGGAPLFRILPSKS